LSFSLKAEVTLNSHPRDESRSCRLGPLIDGTNGRGIVQVGGNAAIAAGDAAEDEAERRAWSKKSPGKLRRGF
jgi:hypothetical protein